ncbi:MAG: carbohydrate-binding family 9-like protein [bacterium]
MKKTAFTIGLFTLAALCVGTAEAGDEPRPRVTVPKLEGVLTCDGELTEAVWDKAAVIPDFQISLTEAAASEKTELRLWYDDEALYLGWICTDSDIQATFTERDSHFWEEEVVEFFITPDDLTEYFELQWNPLGGEFDAIIYNKLNAQGDSISMKGDWDYTAEGMISAVKVFGTVSEYDDKDQKWQVEVKVPFSALHQETPQSGDTWRGNFYRFNRTQGREAELLSWSPTRKPSFHEPARFGDIQFEGTQANVDLRQTEK